MVGIEREKVAGIRGTRYFKLIKHCLEIDYSNGPQLSKITRMPAVGG